MLPVLLALAVAATPPPPPVPRVITVSGDAKVSFRPNQVVASFLLTSAHRDQAGARRASDEKLKAFIKAVREAGVAPANLVITDGGPAPEYRGNEVTGYTMNRSAQLTITDVARVDEVLSAAVRSAATQSGPVLLRHTEHTGFESKARVAAATAARERARGLTEALGARLGLPITVSDRTPIVETVSAGTFSVSPDGAVTPSFASKELTVVSQVTVQFDMEAPL